jgi:hypothetical protein
MEFSPLGLAIARHNAWGRGRRIIPQTNMPLIGWMPEGKTGNETQMMQLPCAGAANPANARRV